MMASLHILTVVEVLDITDDVIFSDYLVQSSEQSKKFGAIPLARGFEVIEGEPVGIHRYVFRWPSRASFDAYRASPVFQALRALRDQSAKVNVIVIDSLE